MKRARPADSDPAAQPAGNGLAPILCPACNGHFRAPPHECAPHRLPCAHTVCLACLDALALADELGCPVCSKPAEPHAADLALAAFAEDLFDTTQQLSSSSVGPALPAVVCADCVRECESALAVGTCSACCDRPVCDAHATLHSRRGHSVVLVAAYADCCPVHARPLEFMCLTDMKALCALCAVSCAAATAGPVKHDDVQPIASADVDAALRSKLCASVSVCASGAVRFIALADELRVSSTGVCESVAASCARFSEGIDALHAALDSCRAQCIGKAMALCKERVKALAAQIDGCEVSAGQLRTAVAMGEAALACSEPHKLARVLEHVISSERLCSAPGPALSSAIGLAFDASGVEDAMAHMCRVQDGWRAYDAPIGSVLQEQTAAVRAIVCRRIGELSFAGDKDADIRSGDVTLALLEVYMATNPEEDAAVAICRSLAASCTRCADVTRASNAYATHEYQSHIGVRALPAMLSLACAHSKSYSVPDACGAALEALCNTSTSCMFGKPNAATATFLALAADRLSSEVNSDGDSDSCDDAVAAALLSLVVTLGEARFDQSGYTACAIEGGTLTAVFAVMDRFISSPALQADCCRFMKLCDDPFGDNELLLEVGLPKIAAALRGHPDDKTVVLAGSEAAVALSREYIQPAAFVDIMLSNVFPLLHRHVDNESIQSFAFELGLRFLQQDPYDPGNSLHVACTDLLKVVLCACVRCKVLDEYLLSNLVDSADPSVLDAIVTVDVIQHVYAAVSVAASASVPAVNNAHIYMATVLLASSADPAIKHAVSEPVVIREAVKLLKWHHSNGGDDFHLVCVCDYLLAAARYRGGQAVLSACDTPAGSDGSSINVISTLQESALLFPTSDALQTKVSELLGILAA